jgi:MFS family permease
MTEVLWNKTGAQPGLMLMRMVLFMIAGGVLGGLLAPRLGYRTTACTGFLLTALCCGCAPGRWSRGGGARAALAIAGLGFTLADAPVYATVMEAIDAGRRASARRCSRCSQRRPA